MNITPLATIGYLIAALAFVFGIRQLSSPATARNGNRVAAGGMPSSSPSCCSAPTTSASSSPPCWLVPWLADTRRARCA